MTRSAHDRRRGVIFDLDGTLADTLGTIAGVVNWSLEQMDRPSLPVEAYKTLVGDGIVKLCERVLPTGTPEQRQTLLESVRRRYQERRSEGAELYPGIRELLDALVSLGGRLAVLSNKPHDLTLATLEDLAVLDRFALVVGQSDAFPPKPDPAAARHVLERLDLDPLQTLYLGDTGTDMWTATAAGVRPVGALWGFRSAEELSACGALHLVSHPREVLHLFSGMV